METFMKELNAMDTSQKMLYAVGGVAAVLSVFALRKLFNRGPKAKNYPRDTVMLHQIGRGVYGPSLSPFVIKLETYLRMAKIPYQNVHALAFSSKGKLPFLTYNGLEVADTSLCIQYVNQKFGVDFNKDLSPSDKALAHAMQVMVDEHTFWFLILIRWRFDNDKSLILKSSKLGRFTTWMLTRSLNQQTWSQGLGRHTEEEVTEMFKKDLQSLSDFIGTKKFLMGDKPCEEDCAVFGHLSLFYFQFFGTRHETLIKDKYPNLAAYCERMKDTYWPDWDECHTHGLTREATK
ncbi:failed axon connections homolog isoform X1 [Haliotis rubra]|uniref:failed axon connections homolog isoform X1 n=1 Tax=Haliotis rubra TaxID=36100 RepID=UPI001EE5296D|nr:failed axon connections homolog isoform X1 [Haliotis rubra]